MDTSVQPLQYKYHGVVTFVHHDKFYAFLEIDLLGPSGNNILTTIHFRPYHVMLPADRDSLRVGSNVLFDHIGEGSPNKTVSGSSGSLIIFDQQKLVHRISEDCCYYDHHHQMKRLRRSIDGIIEDKEVASSQGNDSDGVIVTTSQGQRPTLREEFTNTNQYDDYCNDLHVFLMRRSGYAGGDGVVVRARDVVGIEEEFDLYRMPNQLLILKEFLEKKKFQPEDMRVLKKKLKEVCEGVSLEHLANAQSKLLVW